MGNYCQVERKKGIKNKKIIIAIISVVIIIIAIVGETLGWFDCFSVNNNENDLLIISMVENIQNNSDDASHYLIKF